MSFSITKKRPFRSLGLYRSSGKHAAPHSGMQRPPHPAGTEPHRPAHAASVPRQAEPVEDLAREKAAEASLRSGHEHV